MTPPSIVAIIIVVRSSSGSSSAVGARPAAYYYSSRTARVPMRLMHFFAVCVTLLLATARAAPPFELTPSNPTAGPDFWATKSCFAVTDGQPSNETDPART